MPWWTPWTLRLPLGYEFFYCQVISNWLFWCLRFYLKISAIKWLDTSSKWRHDFGVTYEYGHRLDCYYHFEQCVQHKKTTSMAFLNFPLTIYTTKVRSLIPNAHQLTTFKFQWRFNTLTSVDWKQIDQITKWVIREIWEIVVQTMNR